MTTSFRSNMLLSWIHEKARTRYHSLGFQSKMLETDAGLLHSLVREGDGSRGSIVFVHGLGTSSNSWIRIVHKIADSRRLAALDLPGFGFSSVRRPEGFATFGEHRAALSDSLAGFQDGPVTLVGHSFGGWLCAWHAATHADRVQHLVLVNSVGIYYRGIETLRETFTLNSVTDTKLLLNTMWCRYPWYLK